MRLLIGFLAALLDDKRVACLKMRVLTYFVLILALGFGFRIAAQQLLELDIYLPGAELPTLEWTGAAYVLGWSFFLSLIIPRRFHRPSDVFLFVYLVIVFIPKIFLISVFSTLAPMDAFGISLLLFLPIISVWVASRIKILTDTSNLKDRNYQHNPWFAFMLAFMLWLFFFFLFRDGLSLEFSSHYERRFMFREIISGSGLTGYLINFFAMALAPFIAFVAVQNKSIPLWLLGVFSGLLTFSISGEKFPFLLIAAATALGFVIFSKKELSTGTLLFLMSGISLLTLIEIQFFDFVFWGDWMFRRFVLGPSYITEIYYHYIANNGGYMFSGSNKEQVTFLMGKLYFDNPELNLNTNFVFVELAITGLLGLGGAILFLTFWLKVIDEAYRRTSDKRFFLLALLIATIAFEQRIYSVFLSSGLGVLSVIVFINAVWRPKIYNLQKPLRPN